MPLKSDLYLPLGSDTIDVMRWRPEIKKALDEVIQAQTSPRIAVFDADGTLWKEDLGESFFKYQIQNHLAPGVLKIKDPWQYYKKFVIRDPHGAYGWLAQINEGTPQSTLRSQCTDFFRRHFRKNVSEEMRWLTQELVSHQFEVWVCSASIRWVIEAGVSDLGLSPEHMIAVETRVNEKDIITSDLVTPLPYTSGKKHRLIGSLAGAPLLVAGNSMGDFDMLTLATKLSLVVNYLPHWPEAKTSEESLLQEAASHGWPVQTFS